LSQSLNFDCYKLIVLKKFDFELLRALSRGHANKKKSPKEVISLRDSCKTKGERDFDADRVIFPLDSAVLS
jgi:hypothetical protein